MSYVDADSLHALKATKHHLAHISCMLPAAKQVCYKNRKRNVGKYAYTPKDNGMNTVRPRIDGKCDGKVVENQLRPTWAEHRTSADGPD